MVRKDTCQRRHDLRLHCHRDDPRVSSSDGKASPLQSRPDCLQRSCVLYADRGLNPV